MYCSYANQERIPAVALLGTASHTYKIFYVRGFLFPLDISKYEHYQSPIKKVPFLVAWWSIFRCTTMRNLTEIFNHQLRSTELAEALWMSKNIGELSPH
jgi:hypothetical protein